MGSFNLSCSLSGINIDEGDEILVVKVKDWDNSKGVYELSNYISRIKANQKSRRFNPKLREAILEYTDLEDTDPFEIFHYGSYIDYGLVTGIEDIKDVSATYYFKKELIDLIKDKYTNKKEGYQPSNILLFAAICRFARLVRRELQYSIMVGPQFFELVEAKAQIELLKLHKDILNKKLLQYEEEISYDEEWHIDTLRTLIDLASI